MSEIVVPRLLTVRELSEVTSIPIWRIYEMCKQGKGPPHLRVGRTLRFAADAVVQWIEEQSTQASER